MSAKLKQMPKPGAEPAHDPAQALCDPAWESVMLGNALMNEAARARLTAELTPDDFTLAAHRRIFGAIQELGQTGTISGVAAHLFQHGQLDKIGGLETLLRLDEHYCPLVDLDGGIRLLRSRTVDREAFNLASVIQEQCSRGYTSGADEVRAARERFAALDRSLTASSGGPDTIGGTLAALDGGIQGLLAKPRGQVATCWPQLNSRINGGFQPGELWILAARPSVGKSTAALQMALHQAQRGNRVYFASLEMSKASLLKRLISMAGQIPFEWLMSGDLDSEMRSRVTHTLNRISKFPLTIDDESRTLSQILARIAKGKYSLDVVDYLGLIETRGKFENRNQEVSYVSRTLKRCAHDNNVPLLALSQLNRGNDQDNRTPHLSDLRESGSLEQDADGVLMLHQPGKMKRPGEAPKNQVQMLVQKQRNGMAQLTVYLQMQGQYCRIVEPETGEGWGGA